MQKLDKIYYLYSPTGLGRAMPAGRINPCRSTCRDGERWRKREGEEKKVGERFTRQKDFYAAICTYCVVAIIEHKMKLERNIYEVMRIIGSSLLVKEHIKDLLTPEPEPIQIANCHPTLDLEFD